MSEFLGLLKTFKDLDTEIVVGINGQEVAVKINDMNGDIVTLVETDGGRRYDLCYTQIVVCSALGSGPRPKTKRRPK